MRSVADSLLGNYVGIGPHLYPSTWGYSCHSAIAGMGLLVIVIEEDPPLDERFEA